MALHDILSRQDIELLVETFYIKIRKNQHIGFFFNASIQNWPEHLAKLADFWESNLLSAHSYHGNPLQTHLKLDKTFNHAIEDVHFEFWLKLWVETIDHLFKGPTADLAKMRAHRMAAFLFGKIEEARDEG